MGEKRHLLYRAGPVARAVIREYGLRPGFVSAYWGPASGPKWLMLVGIDRAVIASGLLAGTSPDTDAHRPLLVGASAGGWRALAMACPDPEVSHRELEDGYVRQVIRRGASPAEISTAYRKMLDRLMTPDRTAHVLRAATVDVGLHVSRARGPIGSSRRHAQAATMALAASLNALTPETMRLFFSRVLMHTAPSRWTVDFDGTVVPLTRANLLQAALATGTVPLYMEPVRRIAGTPDGRYVDGGLTDYHLNQQYASGADGIVLFPHFQKRIAPNWFDRWLSRRKPPTRVIEHVLQFYPSPDFVAGLPGGRIPTRDDFTRFIDDPQLRIRRWREAAKASEDLGEQLLDDLERGRIPDLISEM